MSNISPIRILAQFFFLLVPTCLFIAFILWNSQEYYSILRENWLSQSLQFSLGMVCSYYVYQFRWRFIPTFLILVAVFYFTYGFLNYFSFGEFDGFFIAIKFRLFAFLFSIGWVIGWGLFRYSFFPVILSGLFVTINMFLISKTKDINLGKFLLYLLPLVTYSVYIIFTAIRLRQIEKNNQTHWLRFIGRLILFLFLNLVIFFGIVSVLWKDIEAKIEEYGGQGKEGENQMLETKKDGTVQNRQSMGLGSSNQRNKNPEPLFCAHIDNYFPGTDMPNPLYLASMHFTKFDTLTETFERDPKIPFNDEFVPELSNLPLFMTIEDSSKIKNAFSEKFRKTVEIEIYKKRLSKNTFVGPSTAFWVQPITIEKDFQQEFYAAYRAKSYVSSLNSAYFIYNANDPAIIDFQQQRFEELRKAKDYSSIDKKFFDYYTFFPSAYQFTNIKLLADSISKNKIKTIDKVLATRDYFLQKDELGKPLYSYTDNPGIPGLPGANKLSYFLFESHKGYCAYYAAATVFLLRAMKIPCRVVTGFLTVDRSDKNTGWYWYYEDQSHGWVQVYFPEYGWIDFDTTVGDEESQQSPTPDGTPPLHPPKPLAVIDAKVLSVDTLQKLAKVLMNNFNFRDKEYKNIKIPITLSLKQTEIWRDSIHVNLNAIQADDQILALSYDETLNQYSVEKEAANLCRKLPNPLKVDEVFIQKKNVKENESKEGEQHDNQFSFTSWILWMGIGISACLFVLLLLPSLIYKYYVYQTRKQTNIKKKAYYGFKAATFLLHQMNINKGEQSYAVFARDVVDPKYGTQFAAFMEGYLHAKYAQKNLSEKQVKVIQQFMPEFGKKIFSHFSITQRVINFIKVNHTFSFYSTIHKHN